MPLHDIATAGDACTGAGSDGDGEGGIGMGGDAAVQAPRYPKGWGRLLAAIALAGVVLVVLGVLGAVALGVAYATGAPDLALDASAQELLSRIDVKALLVAMTVAQAAAGALAVLFIALLGGRELVRPRAGGLGFALRASAWPLVFSGVVGPCLDLAFALASGTSLTEVFDHVSPGWPLEVSLLALFCASVGLIEEGLCRGLLLEGLLARMGATRRGVIGAVVVSSLVFGAVHVVGSDLSDGAALVQALLKTVQAGALGFVFAVILLETRNLWCVVAMHAAYDFVAIAPSVILGDLDELAGILTQGYVQSGEDALLAVIAYLVTCAFTVPAVVFCVRALRRAEVPERGAFLFAMRQETRPPAPYVLRPSAACARSREEDVLVEAISLTKSYPLSAEQRRASRTQQQRKTAVDRVSFSIRRGEIFGLLGPNGAGKTTTLRLLSTLIAPDAGDAIICGHSIIGDPRSVRASVGFLTSDLRLDDAFTPDYLFDFFAGLHGVDRSRVVAMKAELFARFGVDAFSQTKVANLSTGMRQKVSLVVSIAHDPEVIIFDEPTNGLDLVAARVVTDFLLDLRSQGKTVLLSTHIFDLAGRVCDRVGIIIGGHLVACDDLSALTKNSTLEEVFFKLYDSLEGSADDA